MLFTKYDFEKFKNDPFKLLEEIKQNINNGDTQMIFAREPVTEDYHKEEGIFFIHNKLINLEELSTENITNALKHYTDFMKKHKIQIIKEFDSKCKFAYEGEIPHIKVDNFETLSFYDFNKFHIIDGNTLSRINSENTLRYLKYIDYSYALDSNITSFFARYITNNDIKYKDLYNQIIAKENNIDIGPYIFEIVMHGLKDFGINYKLNKKNKNETQAAFFETLKVLHKEGLFKEKLEKEFINNIIKSTNHLINYYGLLGFSVQIFLISLLEAKYKFGKATNNIKSYVYDELRKAKIPIENRLKAILYLFCDNPGHLFFKKVINIENIENIQKYMKDVDNTGRDIAISLLERYLYGISNIYPYIATNDQGLIAMFRSTKPDYVYVLNGINIPIYKKINSEMEKKYLNFFETNNTNNMIGYQDSTLKDLINIYINKKNKFINLIKK